MVLFLAAVGLTLFFGGMIAIICDPPKKYHKPIALVIFSGVVLLGGAAYAAYQEAIYRENRLGTWVSLEEIEKKVPIKIGDKWYKVELVETPAPEEGADD